MAEQETVPTTRQQSPTPTSAPTQAPSSGGLSASRVQLKRGVQMMGYDAQAALLAPDAAIQKSGGGDGEQVHQAAAHGIASGGGAMPHGGAIQQAFGAHDVSGIQAHTGGAAKEANQAMGAEAYATGNHIAFGQAPDLHTAAHEAAHVIQQEHGVSLSGGVGKVGDAYENHADKVADAVVSGKSAEPILNEMTGGGGGGGGATQKKAIQLMASSEPVQMVVPPVTPPPATPPAPVVADPEAEWRTYCDTTLGAEPDVKAVALGITDTEKRGKFKRLNPVDRRTFSNAGMTPALRDEFFTFDRWEDRTALTVMLANMPHFALYKGLASAALRTKFRDITPDERRDMVRIDSAQVAILLTDEAKLTTWRTLRNVQAVAANPGVLGALGITDPTDTAKIGVELEKISAGKGGERMRRLINEQGFNDAADKNLSIKAIYDTVTTTNVEPFAAMTALKASWVLHGKLTKDDPGFKNVPILKAIAHTAMCSYGTMKPTFIDELITAGGKTPDATTRGELADPKTKGRLVGGYFRAWKAAGGAFDPQTHILDYAIQGGTDIGAYWMYSAGTAAAVVDPKMKGQDVIKTCAIEESPAYNDGFVIVRVPINAPGMAEKVRRPTMWDGLDFDQFAGVDDKDQCFGVTSGGAPEVVVAPVPFSSCVIERNVPM